jgi:hypothetical protein
MSEKLTEEEVYEIAKKRVKNKKDFYGHLGVYVGVNILLIVIWALSGGGYAWFVWPLGIWGVFVLWGALDVFVFSKGVQSDKLAIEKEVEKIKKEQE